MLRVTPFTGLALLLASLTVWHGSARAGADGGDLQTLAADNRAFACALYERLGLQPGNLFFSPYSISTALAMTYAGARSGTAADMRRTLRWSLEGQALHDAFAGLSSDLKDMTTGADLELNIANSLWPQAGDPLREAYVDQVRRCYDGAVTPLDYARDPDAARLTINAWVADKTRDKIQDLILPGVLSPLTRLVLVNAIYFFGTWQFPFDPRATTEADFFAAPGTATRSPFLLQTETLRYAKLPAAAVLELPYMQGQLAFLVVLPDAVDGLPNLEAGLTSTGLDQWLRGLTPQRVTVHLPKFKLTKEFELGNVLAAMGMARAFDPEVADFSGMNGRRDLFIGNVIHKAFVDVREEGTEAAAATAVVMRTTAMPLPPVEFRADHPFLFVIRDNITGSILFMGRMANPAA